MGWLLTQRAPRRRIKGQGARTRPVALGRPRIFILPTRAGMLFALVLLTMLLGSINYHNSLGFALTFLLAGLGFLSILHTHRNLARLEFSAAKTVPVFAGDDARFNVLVKNPEARARYALSLQIAGLTPISLTELAGHDTRTVTLAQPAPRRGMLAMQRLTASTRFPLGLFCAWSHLHLDAHCLVYPAPLGARPLALSAAPDAGNHAHGAGEDDFAGLRAYRPGDAPARIHWKSIARGQDVLTKEFSGAAPDILWLDWEMLHDLDAEQRLSQLCRHVLDAAAANLHYGLRLPGLRIEPASGDAHRHACLRALALFNENPTQRR